MFYKRRKWKWPCRYFHIWNMKRKKMIFTDLFTICMHLVFIYSLEGVEGCHVLTLKGAGMPRINTEGGQVCRLLTLLIWNM